jgi:hypothetical protein
VGEERLAALQAECARPVALGALRVRLLPADGDIESCLVMQDIEGNEACLDWVAANVAPRELACASLCSRGRALPVTRM